MLSGLLQHLLSVPAWLVLVTVGGLVFAEDALFIGFVLPAETAAILGGVAAKLGHVPFWAVLVTVIAAAIIGDSVGYEVGRHFGPALLRLKLLRSRRRELDSARDLLARRGGAAVFLGRWVAFLRALMPALAGMSGMRYSRFLSFNALGGIAWGAAVVSLGYLAGASYATIEKAAGRGIGITLAVLVVIGVIAWRVSRRRQAASQEGQAASQEADDSGSDRRASALDRGPAGHGGEGERDGVLGDSTVPVGPASRGPAAPGDARVDPQGRSGD